MKVNEQLKEITKIKEGDQLIFISDGGTLSTGTGYVYTFSN